MVSRNKVIAAVVFSAIVLSLIFLIPLALNASLDRDSSMRLLVFMVLHFYTVIICIVFVFVRGLYNLMLLLLCWSGGCAAVFTCCQLYIRANEPMNEKVNFLVDEIIELFFLKVYFLCYADSIVCFIWAGVFIVATHCFLWWDDLKMRQAVEKCFREVRSRQTQVQYGEKSLYVQCSICINEFDQGEMLVETMCKHLFHKHCLMEWIKIRRVCPNDRKNLFQYDENQ